MSGISGIDFGLLKFCLEHTDAPNLQDTVLPDRDPKDYEWLRKALGDLEDDATRMKKLIKIAHGEISPTEGLDAKSDKGTPEEKGENTAQLDTETRRYALEELQYYVEDIDNALNFAKLGGIRVLTECMSPSEHHDIRYWAAWVLGTLVQNNPPTQVQCLKEGALKVTIEALCGEHADVKEKAIFLLSGLLRDSDVAVAAFVDHGGVGVLRPFVDAEAGKKIAAKTIFLLTQLLRTPHREKVQNILVSEHFLAPISKYTESDNTDLREKAFELLLEALRGSSPAKEWAKGAGLPASIRSRGDHLAGLDKDTQADYEHERHLIRELRKII
eukprot:TRINITY_DN670_c0_g1_i3.p1 TRINITY_DN670_c0_g1~~TRINITY_DN670_c0_g1_i3.p1  ORF type:complete len:329 (-),score=65.87 TRINITY_DN670_c0_g1_i3:3-989(-)